MTEPAREKASLAVQREVLRLRSEALRQGLAWRAQKVRPAFTAADRVALGVQWARNNRELLGVAAAALVGSLLVRPRTTLALGTRAFAAWKLVQRAQPVLRMLSRLR